MTINKLFNNNVDSNVLRAKKNPSPIKPPSDSLIPEKDSIIDILSISDEAKNLLTEDEKLFENQKKSAEYADMLRQLDILRESANAPNPYMDKIKCLQISMRLMSGDRVPNKDIAFLAEKEPQMYANSMMLALIKENPKKFKSLLEDEKIETAEETQSEASPPIESADNTSSVEESAEVDSVE